MFHSQSPQISPEHIQQLTKARGWIITFAVILFIGCALLILGSIGNLLSGNTTAFQALLNLAIGIFYLLAGIKFCQYSGKLKQVHLNPTPINLESAFSLQAKAWMWLGICAIIYLVLCLFVFLMGLIATI